MQTYIYVYIYIYIFHVFLQSALHLSLHSYLHSCLDILVCISIDIYISIYIYVYICIHAFVFTSLCISYQPDVTQKDWVPPRCCACWRFWRSSGRALWARKAALDMAQPANPWSSADSFCIYAYIHMYVFIYIYIYICRHRCIHIYMYVYIHLHAHYLHLGTYIPTEFQVRRWYLSWGLLSRILQPSPVRHSCRSADS